MEESPASPVVEVRQDEDFQDTTPPSRQITKENVTRLNTNVVELKDDCLSSPEGGPQSERSSQYLDRFPMRESSSAFLASLTSASQISSPITSAFPSMDSLQSAKDGQNVDSIAGSAQSGSLIEMAMAKPAQSVTSSEDTARKTPEETTPSSIPLDTAQEWYHKTPTNYDRHHDFDIKTPSRTHTPSQSSTSTPGEHIRSESSIPGHAFYSSGAHDEEYEQSHSKTPLMHALDYPPPKETRKAIKAIDEDGNKTINQYETIQKLGAGAHGAVKLGRDTKSGQYVAIKIVKRYPKKPRLGKNENPEDKVKKEVAVLKKARHPHVVSLLEVIDDPQLKKVYLVLEYVERGEIKWRKQTDREIAKFEMNRMRREVAGDLDEAAETDHLMMFNEDLLQRYFERNARSVTSSSASGSYSADHDVEEYSEYRPYRITSRHSSRPSSRPVSRPPSDLDISTASHTLRVPSRASNRDLFTNEPEFSGSMYSSYIEEASVIDPDNFERDRWLNDEPSLNQQWTAEEEEYRFVPCLTLSEARDVFRDTVLGLEYLHYHGIIHRDIKPANLLWTKDYRVKISDFGVSYLGRPLSGEDDEDPLDSEGDVAVELAKTVGTPAFYAPELCDPDLFDMEKLVSRPRITGKIDVWALGITLYAMVYGRLPFYDQNEFTMYEKIARAEVLIPSKRLRGVDYEEGHPTNSNKREEHVLMYEDVDDDLRDLLRRLLVKDPTKRITVKEVKHHPWLLRGVDNPSNWIQVTDPAYKGTRIEVSQADLKEAVVQRTTFFDKVWTGIANITRGRVPSRRRAETSSKNHIKRNGSSLSRSNTVGKDVRRSSLRGDELSIVNTLRATRDPVDHPLARSTVVTPTATGQEQYFPPIQQVDSQGNLIRPSIKAATTADSILTVRGYPRHDDNFGFDHYQHHHPTASDSGGSSSSLAKIIDNTREVTRRFTSRVRGRETQSVKSEEFNASSRASSGDNIALSEEGRCLKPSLAMSPAIAAGHVEPPPSLYPESSQSSPAFSPIPSGSTLAGLPSTESFQNFERGRTGRQRASTANSTSWSAVSPTVEDRNRAHISNIAGPTSRPLQQIPSRGFLPLTGNTPWMESKPFVEALQATPAYAATSEASASLLTTGETITPAIMKQKELEREEKEKKRESYRSWREAQKRILQERRKQRLASQPKQPEDEHEDEGSDDEGLVMGARKGKATG